VSFALILAAAEDFQPQHEFELPAWVPIHLGPIDMSINKAVVYLWVGALVTIVLGIWIMRFGLSLRPSRRQTTGEALYELIQGQIAEGNLPSKAIGRWFPYVASLFLFIWILNLVGFVPLPISSEKFELFGLKLPTWGIYAATANLSVTLGLALIKRALDAAWDNDLDTQLDLEREFQREASLTPDYAEGVRAFMEKRAPVFSGRRSRPDRS